jgi:hypothetical protein
MDMMRRIDWTMVALLLVVITGLTVLILGTINELVPA